MRPDYVRRFSTANVTASITATLPGARWRLACRVTSHSCEDSALPTGVVVAISIPSGFQEQARAPNDRIAEQIGAGNSRRALPFPGFGVLHLSFLSAAVPDLYRYAIP